ncbi:nuclear transport factor 2 family protein [Arthrobacter sp. ISL-30]|uniref:nuclear transport factor 2 family protein n=1 Tax=Arthrobacter sp. ISL-30 TaxID=2819109 RepID=UPI001BEA7DB7|nr:nuclear transport factor 2 family protein [Arthrobacter sp. ISL-30]MBT2514878.1 nuclear transport factor 2 family protein [Arthrobacter sp. ISL-30]
MELSIENIARAFSHHRFDDAIPYLSNDVAWQIVGAEDLIGKQSVVDVCKAQGMELEKVRTEFDQFKVVVAEDCVVIDSVARYIDPNGEVSTIASCDIFDFISAQISHIRSYNIELTPQ